MAYRKLPEITEPLDDLLQRFRNERQAERKRRLHLLVLIQRGQAVSRRQAADLMAVHRNTVGLWLNDYATGGLDGLLNVGQAGRPVGQRLLPEAVLEAVKVRLGHSNGIGGYTELQRWLNDEFELPVVYSSLHSLVRYRLGAKLKTPRPEHPKKTSLTLRPSPLD